MKKIILTLFILTFSISIYSADLTVPKKSIVISQSCSIGNLFITIIDLENNEIVILQYGNPGFYEGKFKLINIIRTGTIVDPKEQMSILGKNVPLKTNN